MRPINLRSAAELGANKPHGTRIKYMSGCKCMLCRAANSRYQTTRAAQRRQGLDNGFVSAKYARAHIIRLSKKGIGRRTISIASGIPQSSILKIKKGIKQYIRKNTHRRITAVSDRNAAGAVLISAEATWRMINKLLAEGFTKKGLAKRLGYKTPALQINRNVVTANTAIKISSFYRRIMAI